MLRDPSPNVGVRLASTQPAEGNLLVSLLFHSSKSHGQGGESGSWSGGILTNPSPYSLAPGARLAERYLIRGALGRGGMGEVYEAWDEELSIEIALKTLNFDPAHHDSDLRRFKREVLFARSISHPGVCRVYDLGRHESGPANVWFLTMQLLRGGSLKDRIMSGGSIPLEEALPLVEQLAAGLSAAHRAGVLHRDFKSANVMLVPGPAGTQAVITDFGLARGLTSAHAPGETGLSHAEDIVGTPDYMAPEQITKQELGPAADIYALGGVLYEMVTGRLPFEGPSPIAILSRRVNEEPPSPRTIVPGLPEIWESVILRCLARDPRERFASPEGVADTLSGRVSVQHTSSPQIRSGQAFPRERDALVGRESDLAQMALLLPAQTRLLTLSGAGGMGKTRLAIRHGWQTEGDWPGGLWFCDLTEARDLNGVAASVAAALAVPLRSADPIEQLADSLAHRARCLLVLDNCEQVASPVREALDKWLDRARSAHFLVTSRERLNLREELVWLVEPLAPQSGEELFIERARRQRPGLRLEGKDLADVREAVSLLEGVPLAIELAAARIRIMTPGQLVARMREHLNLLGRAEGGRHSTLKAAIDGSWELLAPWERSCLAQCSVFEGGFTLSAAEMVLDPGPGAPWALDAIQTLVDKSLLRSWVPEVRDDGEVSEVRFGMFVSIQDYAAEKLSGDIQGAAAARQRHARWYAALGTEENLESLRRHDGWKRRPGFEREYENLLVACRRAMASGDGAGGVCLLRAICDILELRGPLPIGLELCQQLLGLSLSASERSATLALLGVMELYLGLGEQAREHFEAACAGFRDAGDRLGEALVRGKLAIVSQIQGNVEEAAELYERTMRTLQELGQRRREGEVLGNLSVLNFEVGRMEQALTQFKAALSIHREVGNRVAEGLLLGNLANFYRDQGRLDEARAAYDDALFVHRQVRDRRGEARVLGNLGNLYGDEGRLPESQEAYEAAIQISRQTSDRRLVGVNLGNLANLLRDRRNFEAARSCYEEALQIHRQSGEPRAQGVIYANLGALHLEEGRLPAAVEALRKGHELLLEVGDRIELGKLLCTRAVLERRSEDFAAAARTLAEVAAIVTEVGAQPNSELVRTLEETRKR